MSYIKAEEILPEELILQIQEYIDGVYIYIPRKPGTRHTWGQETDYKVELKTRNDHIRKCCCAEPEISPVRKEHPQDSAKIINQGAVPLTK